MTLEHYIQADDKRKAVIVVKDSSGRTYKLERNMGKDGLLEYTGKVSELWESAEAQEIGEETLNRVRRTSAELKAAIELDDGKVLGPTFSELKMVSMAYIIVKTYRSAAAKNQKAARAAYKLAAQDLIIGGIVQQLGKDYRTAVSGYRDRAPFDNYIKKIATDLSLDGDALVELLHQACPVQKKKERPRGFTGIRSTKAQLMERMIERGVASAPSEERTQIMSKEEVSEKLRRMKELGRPLQAGEGKPPAEESVEETHVIPRGLEKAGLEPEGGHAPVELEQVASAKPPAAYAGQQETTKPAQPVTAEQAQPVTAEPAQPTAPLEEIAELVDIEIAGEELVEVDDKGKVYPVPPASVQNLQIPGGALEGPAARDYSKQPGPRKEAPEKPKRKHRSRLEKVREKQGIGGLTKIVIGLGLGLTALAGAGYAAYTYIPQFREFIDPLLQHIR